MCRPWSSPAWLPSGSSSTRPPVLAPDVSVNSGSEQQIPGAGSSPQIQAGKGFIKWLSSVLPFSITNFRASSRSAWPIANLTRNFFVLIDRDEDLAGEVKHTLQEPWLVTFCRLHLQSSSPGFDLFGVVGILEAPTFLGSTVLGFCSPRPHSSPSL